MLRDGDCKTGKGMIVKRLHKIRLITRGRHISKWIIQKKKIQE